MSKQFVQEVAGAELLGWSGWPDCNLQFEFEFGRDCVRLLWASGPLVRGYYGSVPLGFLCQHGASACAGKRFSPRGGLILAEHVPALQAALAEIGIG